MWLFACWEHAMLPCMCTGKWCIVYCCVSSDCDVFGEQHIFTEELGDKVWPDVMQSSARLRQKVHRARHRSTVKMCTWCGQSFIDNDELMQHVEEHLRGNYPLSSVYTCSVCNKPFTSLFNVRSHEALHRLSEQNRNKIHVNSSKTYSCSICKKSFTSKSYVKKHEAAHQRNFRNSISSKLLDWANRKPAAKIFACAVCGKAFTKESNYLRHEAVHHTLDMKERHTVESGGKVEYAEVWNRDMRRKQLCRVYVCPNCGQRFLRLFNYEQHRSSSCVLQCMFCGKISKKLSNHKRHMATHMPKARSNVESVTPGGSGVREKRVHMCSECGRSFATTTTLKSHILTHTGERPLACRIEGCDKRFAQHSTRAFHERTHSDDAPHICPDCGRAFKHPITLRLHSTVHTDVRPYKCPECPKSFRKQSVMSMHLRVHSDARPFSCSHCPKTFRSVSCLRRHVVSIHERKKPYNCSVCDKGFTQPGNLRTHMRTHTGEKPFMCTFCGMRFSHSGTLKGHLRTHSTAKKLPGFI